MPFYQTPKKLSMVIFGPCAPASNTTLCSRPAWPWRLDGTLCQFTTVKLIKELFVKSNGKARLTLVKDEAKTEANQP
jgi:hypothetical protein